MTDQRHQGTRKGVPRWATIVVAVLVVIGVVLAALAKRVSPLVRARAIAILEDRFDSKVEIQDLEIQVYPLSIKGGGLALRYHGQTNLPPLIAVEEFSAQASLLGLLRKPWHIGQIRIKGLEINVPPKGQRDFHFKPSDGPKSKYAIPVMIDELVSDNAQLTILTDKPGKEPHIFSIHSLAMRGLGLGRSAAFTADLTNATPPGEIHAAGQFGPWQKEEPGETPLSAKYTFDHADLGPLKGIAGILTSKGQFGGVLDEIAVNGETDTPDFMVEISGHKVHLSTQFDATVDGTNGETLLHPVIAKFLNSTLVCNGGVVKPESGPGREVVLDVVAKAARIEDLLQLAVKSNPPLMTGAIDLHTKFDLPPGPKNIAEKLKLNGQFDVKGVRFTGTEIRKKLQALSSRAQGNPEDLESGSSISKLKGHFILRDALITFRGLVFEVEGASVQLDGTYGLLNENLDFHGNLVVEAKLSQMVTGFKSALLKIVDPFFRHNGKTILPIKITGTRDKPSFGLDLHHKKQ